MKRSSRLSLENTVGFNTETARATDEDRGWKKLAAIVGLTRFHFCAAFRPILHVAVCPNVQMRIMKYAGAQVS
jgi:hypothetical protein